MNGICCAIANDYRLQVSKVSSAYTCMLQSFMYLQKRLSMLRALSPALGGMGQSRTEKGSLTFIKSVIFQR